MASPPPAADEIPQYRDAVEPLFSFGFTTTRAYCSGHSVGLVCHLLRSDDRQTFAALPIAAKSKVDARRRYAHMIMSAECTDTALRAPAGRRSDAAGRLAAGASAPLPFHARRLTRSVTSLLAWLLLTWRYRRIRRRVIADPARSSYIDDALRLDSRDLGRAVVAGGSSGIAPETRQERERRSATRRARAAISHRHRLIHQPHIEPSSSPAPDAVPRRRPRAPAAGRPAACRRAAPTAGRWRSRRRPRRPRPRRRSAPERRAAG
jgi:hypothetical protein